MKEFSRLAVLVLTVLGCVGCDQSAKIGAQGFLRGHAPMSFFDGLFNFVYAENTGAMLSIGGRLPEGLRFAFFVLFVGLVLVAAIAFVLVKPLNKSTVVAVSLVVGGGISNVIDRLVHGGSVVDFMLIKIGSLQTGIFNVADMAITLGTCVLCLSAFASKGERT